ncbi:helix-turn-helix transcriptional regulator [Tumebacillus permanentifrigoris]|uniref:DNA-binding XRE family transcriptional regulator n=1 Tax=Tumebacillus permanentifrigoris TaxID=378543 RepID=A0A316DEH4_9BACL|nr:helix-turn-helix transcriptional regulator [Tumebacillus permanentifrigoris]PWK15579.1 DNA-binding XRE family transcriptional regulator [Tumebacillus permanentifrigoris]
MKIPLHIEKETLGERVKRYRTEREMSQEKLAEFCGVTNGWISKLEKDKYSPSPELITKLASSFKIPVHELLQEEDQRMELISRIKLISVLLETNQLEEAEEYIHELETHPELSKKDELTLKVLFAECRYLQGHYNESLEILLPLIDSLEMANYHDAHLLSNIRNKVGNNYFLKRDFTKAFYNYNKAYEYTLRYDEIDPLIGRITFNVAYTLRILGRYHEADYFLEQSHQNCQAMNDLKQMAKTFYEQGMLYSKRHEFEKAAASFEQSKTIFEALNLQSLYVIVQDSYAMEITARHEPITAIQQLHDCIGILNQYSMYDRLILNYAKMAKIQLGMKKFSEANGNLLHAIELIATHEYQALPESGECYKVYAKYFYELEQYQNSIHYALKSSDIFDRMKLLRDQVEALQIAADAYDQLGETRKANEILKQCNQILLQNHEGR